MLLILSNFSKYSIETKLFHFHRMLKERGTGRGFEPPLDPPLLFEPHSTQSGQNSILSAIG